MRFEWVDTDSVLWRLLDTPQAVPGWRRWQPVEPLARPLVRLDGTHDEYLQANFSRKARYNLRREDRLLDEATGQTLTLDVVTRPDQVAGFIDDFAAVVAASGQLEHGAKGVPNPGAMNRRLHWYAEHGLLRSYVLRSATEPVAVLLAFAHDDTLLASTPAYSQQWAKYSPGKALWNRVLADVSQLPEISYLDFGNGDYPYKRHFANDEYEMGRSVSSAAGCGRPGDGGWPVPLTQQLRRTALRVATTTSTRSAAEGLGLVAPSYSARVDRPSRSIELRFGRQAGSPQPRLDEPRREHLVGHACRPTALTAPRERVGGPAAVLR